MGSILEALLNTHLGAGGYAVLMSATLGSAARRRWILRKSPSIAPPHLALSDAIATPYPAVTVPAPDGEQVTGAGNNNQRKRVRIAARPLMHAFADVAGLALHAARAGAKVLVVRNTVGHAVATQRAIEVAAGADDDALLFQCNCEPTLHTGRFAAADRRQLDDEVGCQLDKHRPDVGRIVRRHPAPWAVTRHRRRPAPHRSLPHGCPASADWPSPPP